jgi:hypothetical protein
VQSPFIGGGDFSRREHILEACVSDRGGWRAAAMYSLIVTAKMNDVDPQAWLADVRKRPI